MIIPAPVSRYTPDNAKNFTSQIPANTNAAALAQLKTRGLPTPRLERWKYTNIASFIQSGARAATKVALNTNPLELPWLMQTSRKFVFVNGFMALGDARLTFPKTGAAFDTAPLNKFDDAMLWALNASFAVDGPDITITENGTVFEIMHIGQAGDAPLFASPHTRINIAANTSATVIEQFYGLGKTPVHTNAATQIVLADGAKLEHIRFQNEKAERAVFNATHIKVGRDATYNGSFLNLGASLARQEYWAEIEAPGAHCAIKGAQLINGRQHIDTTVLIEHKAPNCTSNQTIRNVVCDEGTGVFQGKIYVDQAAQKTDGYQLCNTLMLSPRAQMNTKPELEIYADDVKCSHGTTTGKMDETALFYLRSRGIPEAEARAMILKAFIGNVFDELPDAAKTLFEEHVEGWLADATT